MVAAALITVAVEKITRKENPSKKKRRSCFATAKPKKETSKKKKKKLKHTHRETTWAPNFGSASVAAGSSNAAKQQSETSNSNPPLSPKWALFLHKSFAVRSSPALTHHPFHFFLSFFTATVSNLHENSDGRTWRSTVPDHRHTWWTSWRPALRSAHCLNRHRSPSICTG